MLSNPPYSNKSSLISRCMDLKKPWCMLLPIPTLCSSIINRFINNDENFQLFIPTKRMRFDTKEIKAEDRPGPTFKAAYFGYRFFEKQLILEH